MAEQHSDEFKRDTVSIAELRGYLCMVVSNNGTERTRDAESLQLFKTSLSGIL